MGWRMQNNSQQLPATPYFCWSQGGYPMFTLKGSEALDEIM